MSGTTRARQIRADIVAAIAAATLDDRAGSGDRFTHLDVSRRPDGGARERSFRVIAAVPPHRGDLMSSSYFRAEFTVELYYSLGKGIDDRICDDAERFWWALETLQSRNDGIQNPQPAWLGVEETTHNAIARVSVTVEYRLDAALTN